MKITTWHLSFGLGILICFLGWSLMNTFWYECFICHGIAPSLTQNLFCLGVQMVSLIGILLIALGLYGTLYHMGEKPKVKSSDQK